MRSASPAQAPSLHRSPGPDAIAETGPRYVSDAAPGISRQRSVDAGDAYAYLHAITGAELMAKDFRPWGGTVLAARHPRDSGGSNSEGDSHGHIVVAVKTVAAQLGSTPAVCRTCNIDSAMFEAFLDGTIGRAFTIATARTRIAGTAALSPPNAAVLRLLRRRVRGRGAA